MPPSKILVILHLVWISNLINSDKILYFHTLGYVKLLSKFRSPNSQEKTS